MNSHSGLSRGRRAGAAAVRPYREARRRTHPSKKEDAANSEAATATPLTITLAVGGGPAAPGASAVLGVVVPVPEQPPHRGERREERFPPAFAITDLLALPSSNTPAGKVQVHTPDYIFWKEGPSLLPGPLPGYAWDLFDEELVPAAR